MFNRRLRFDLTLTLQPSFSTSTAIMSIPIPIRKGYNAISIPIYFCSKNIKYYTLTAFSVLDAHPSALMLFGGLLLYRMLSNDKPVNNIFISIPISDQSIFYRILSGQLSSQVPNYSTDTITLLPLITYYIVCVLITVAILFWCSPFDQSTMLSSPCSLTPGYDFSSSYIEWPTDYATFLNQLLSGQYPLKSRDGCIMSHDEVDIMKSNLLRFLDEINPVNIRYSDHCDFASLVESFRYIVVQSKADYDLRRSELSPDSEQIQQNSPNRLDDNRTNLLSVSPVSDKLVRFTETADTDQVIDRENTPSSASDIVVHTGSPYPGNEKALTKTVYDVSMSHTKLKPRCELRIGSRTFDIATENGKNAWSEYLRNEKPVLCDRAPNSPNYNVFSRSASFESARPKSVNGIESTPYEVWSPHGTHQACSDDEGSKISAELRNKKPRRRRNRHRVYIPGQGWTNSSAFPDLLHDTCTD
ncbi:hypothetical protein CANCADRAFT_76127 [Tortispora caseinolytica NRRL Y-17796]|uniref:Uncharacterized protein n=1 Tax=Tortispora caseinolytica NRRL Y-17796 TaxID=767744 RepID=A0A1E4TJI0_9ASCO|nr:hypothetical protein CANCADRAFT_76127 [Tortispora caseinolytica NRRL Y-17796]